MTLIEQTSVTAAQLPVAEFKEHLRLGTGFGDDGLQDGLAESYLRSALAAIEGRIGKVLIQKSFSWGLNQWRDGAAQALPVAPVQQILSLVLLDQDGAEEMVDPSRYRLVKDSQRPRIAGAGTWLPAIPTQGEAWITFKAGFGTDWTDVPADLRQAVFLLGAEYYETRHEGGASKGAIPFGVLALIERWRTVRVLGGGQA
ncbi:head-tail connector protein [Acidimangrovimonas sediminis]|uniref:head-tail connector protein n=1 Tax=Acidimangrovimonas sediminis TaxID=2056283 RepID=UPI000C80F814|nr:hypothetical protein [Acidimangrovimonas sediminis]